MTPNRILWTDPRISSSVYEDMVAVLISRLHPEAQRVDGSGGDGGRDVLLPLPSGTEIFELKSFTGRMDSGRRGQVKRSLKRAAQNSPSAWHLVVPIDPTPGESKWFREKLTASYQFPCDWCGKSWLDNHMADYPELSRYYIDGSSDEIVTALRELKSEQALLVGGLPDAINRISALTKRLNELDPHYYFAYSSSPVDGLRVTVIPRYLGAGKDSPVRINASFQFPDTEEGRAAEAALQDAVAYGTAATVSGDFVTQVKVDGIEGIADLFTGGELRLSPVQPGQPIAEPQFALRVIDNEGNVATQLPLKVVGRSAGTQGAELTLTDLSGVLTVTMRGSTTTRHFTLNYRFLPPDGMLPNVLLPALRFLSEVESGKSVVLLINGQYAGPPMPPSQSLPDEFRGYAKLVAQLNDVQHKSGVYFPIPSSLSADELADIAMAAQLFEGEVIEAEWSSSHITLRADALGGLAELAKGEVRDLWGQVPYLLSLNGQEYPLGYIFRKCATARAESWPEISPNMAPDAEVEITLIPGSDSSLTIKLVEEFVDGGDG